jgi:hypothetical protein
MISYVLQVDKAKHERLIVRAKEGGQQRAMLMPYRWGGGGVVGSLSLWVSESRGLMGEFLGGLAPLFLELSASTSRSPVGMAPS